jgi:hypothetical protein
MRTFTERQAKYAAIKQYLKDEHGICNPLENNPWLVCSSLDPEFYDACVYEVEGGEVLVVTESERDERWNESLENYIDECVLPELPEIAQQYFDYEKWKRDARYDGAGHCLSHYDGVEHEYKFGDHWIYIYRQN